MVIPKRDFRGLDFNQLERFEIMLTGASQPILGNLVFDEIAFSGPKELVFESDRDNLIGFPEGVADEARQNKLAAIEDPRHFIEAVARDTWQYFESLADSGTHLVVDHVRVGDAPGVGGYTSPTNVALDWLSHVAAFDLSLISKAEAVRNIRKSLETFRGLKRWDVGFWYNYYNTRNLRVTREYVSVVDNGWLAAALVVIRQAFPEEFAKEADTLLKQLDFSEFYDRSNGQLRLGFDAAQGAFSPHHYGLIASEARLASYVAIGKGDLEPEHWARIYRTLPVEWTWQKQKPEGEEKKLFGTGVFEGHYQYLNQKFVPSWGGSLFEFLSPTLLLDEQKLAPRGLGRNNEIVTDLHIEYALRVKHYPVWGASPCAVRSGRNWTYREYGVSDLGSKGYQDRGVITPYATFLALATRPEEAVKNLREMLKRYPGIYGDYGFYDSVDVAKSEVNHQYLALDQGMSLLAMANYLKDGVMRKHFHSDPVGKNGEKLLQEEVFSIN